MNPKAKRALREALAERIERELALLDKLDGDPDLEPALGAAENHPGGYQGEADQSDWYAPQTHDDREDDGDDLEPSLGGGGTWTDAGLQYDLEEDRSDYEYGGDEEPNLGRLETLHQGSASYGGSDPAELGYEFSPKFTSDGYREGRDLLRDLRRRGASVQHVPMSPALWRDPDELTIIAPGVARVGKWL
ncbi:MAG: hypothetical protein H0T56_03395 [Pseudaminobacter sp.]|nr:hypothetical protein [Pseudaminobacter sp.]